MWYVYLAECGDGSLYTGIAVDPRARLKQHNAGTGSAYVRSRGGARLVYVERCATQSSALKKEAAVKSWPRAQKLALIRAQPRGRVARLAAH